MRRAIQFTGPIEAPALPLQQSSGNAFSFDTERDKLSEIARRSSEAFAHFCLTAAMASEALRGLGEAMNRLGEMGRLDINSDGIE